MIQNPQHQQMVLNTLCTTLQDTNPAIRAKSAEALGTIGSTQIIPNLLTALQDPEPIVRQQAAIALFQQKALLIEQAAEIINIDVDDFYQILVDRSILTPPADPDDDPDELILAHLRISLQQVKEGKFSPIETLWEGIDE
jgi:predicted HTH domain antitoxin